MTILYEATINVTKPRLSHQEKRGFVHNILFCNAIPKHYIYINTNIICVQVI